MKMIEEIANAEVFFQKVSQRARSNALQRKNHKSFFFFSAFLTSIG